MGGRQKLYIISRFVS